MKLSVIFGARNDGYGDTDKNPYEISYLHKIRYGIESLHRSLQNVDYEIVIMDINPIPERSLIYDYFVHPRVRSFVFSNERFLWHVNKHFNAGAKFLTDHSELNRKDVIKLGYSFLSSLYDCLPTITGEYILMISPDTIFPYGFNNIVKNLSPNILYRCAKKNINYLGNIFNESIFEQVMNKKNLSFITEIENNNVYKAIGDFILIDRNSLIEMGPFLPLPVSRVRSIDGLQVLLSLVYEKKILPIDRNDYYITQFPPFLNEFKRKQVTVSDYRVNYNNFSYQYSKEMHQNNYKIFKKWASNHMSYNNNLFYNGSFCRYKKRHEEIKKMFKDILSGN